MHAVSESRRRGLAAALLAALACTTGCAYFESRGRDALDMFDIGFTFSKKLQFGIYANCPFIAPGGYSNVDATYVGLGGGKFGVMEQHQKALGLVLWGREAIEWGEQGTDASASAGAHGVGPLGLATDAEGNPDYKPQCAHYFHLGFVGVTGNLNYKEWGDFFLGWLGLDICHDDYRARHRSYDPDALAQLSERVAQPRMGLQLVIRTDKPSYAMDEPIVLDVSLLNRTGESRDRRDRPRDLSLYFEPLAKTPEGDPAEWLFKFRIFQPDLSLARGAQGATRYSSPAFDVPADQRGAYYHYADLPPASYLGRRFVLPPARVNRWLEPGPTLLVATYEVNEDYPYVILNHEFTARDVEALGTDLAYTRVWTGKLCSNIVTVQIRRDKILGLF